jgi:hypothetical protein
MEAMRCVNRTMIGAHQGPTQGGVCRPAGLCLRDTANTSADRAQAAHNGASPLPLTRPVDRGTGEVEEVVEFSGALLAAIT